MVKCVQINAYPHTSPYSDQKPGEGMFLYYGYNGDVGINGVGTWGFYIKRSSLSREGVSSLARGHVFSCKRRRVLSCKGRRVFSCKSRRVFSCKKTFLLLQEKTCPLLQEKTCLLVVRDEQLDLRSSHFLRRRNQQPLSF